MSVEMNVYGTVRLKGDWSRKTREEMDEIMADWCEDTGIEALLSADERSANASGHLFAHGRNSVDFSGGVKNGFVYFMQMFVKHNDDRKGLAEAMEKTGSKFEVDFCDDNEAYAEYCDGLYIFSAKDGEFVIEESIYTERPYSDDEVRKSMFWEDPDSAQDYEATTGRPYPFKDDENRKNYIKE